MSSAILRVLDHIEEVITDLDVRIRKKSLRGVKIELERLKTFSDCLKYLIPEEFAKELFSDFDRHVHFVGVFQRKKDFEWMKSNLDDITREDLPNIKSKIFDFVGRGKLPEKTFPLSNNVFIVHGRDRKSLKELKAMLVGFDLNPIVLHEKASSGLTLAEKLEKYSEDVGYAFVILTSDDLGTLRSKFVEIRPQLLVKRSLRSILNLKPRARQNVIFEMGYFWGLLKRKKVCCLLKGDVEKPSDIEGIVYISFKESVNEVRDKIVKELKAAGYEIKI